MSRTVRQPGGLTTRGRSLLAGGLAAAVCAILLDERDLLRIGVAVAALPLVSAAIVLGRRIRVSAIRRVAPDRLSPGVEGQIEITVTYGGMVRGRPMELTAPAVPGLSEGMRCAIPPMRRGAAVSVRYPILPAYRGRFGTGPLVARSIDPLGLCAVTRTVADDLEVVVLPAVVPLRTLPTSGGGHSAASGASLRGVGDGNPDVLVRQYQPGDDIRTIHWRASARRDDLVVRTREQVAHGDATVILDHRAVAHHGVGMGSSLETAVSAVASIGARLLDADYRLRVLSHDSQVISVGPVDDLLLDLVDLDAGDGPLAPPRTGGTVIAVTGRLSAADSYGLAAARASGARAIALVVDGPGSSDVGIAALRAAGWSVQLLPPGSDLAPLWDEACRRGSVTVPS